MTDSSQPFVLKNTSHRQFSMPTLNRLSWVREEQVYTSLGTRFEQLASGHWVWDEVSRLLGVITVYGVRRLSFCPKECLHDSEDTGSPALQFPLSFHSAAVECCSGRFLGGQLYCSVHKASCCLQPCLVTILDSSHGIQALKHRWETHRRDQQRAVSSM